MESWEGVPVAEWQARWRIPALHVHAATGSTNDDARALALRGAPAGSVVIAEHQSAGRGREGRVWEADPGTSLLLSVILRPVGNPGAGVSPLTPLRVGLAVAAAVEACAGLSTRLKWPNDVLAGDGRKLGGILCEAAHDPGGAFAVAGIGLNVLQRQWPDPLAATATSILVAAGRAPGRPELAAAILDALRPFEPGGPRMTAPELRAYQRLDALRGRVIEVDGARAGVADGIDPDGGLRILTPEGVRVLRSGTVRIDTHSRRTAPEATGGRALHTLNPDRP